MGLLDEVSYAPSLLMMNAFPATSSYRPDLPAASNQKFDRVRDFGPRWNESAQAPTKTSLKGYGWLGLMPTQSGGVMSEFSGSAPLDRKDLKKGWMTFPQVVPGLNRSEVNYLLTEPKDLAPIPTKNRAIDDSVYQKALQWAQMRRMQGLDSFID